jgi:hypothetical protein
MAADETVDGQSTETVMRSGYTNAAGHDGGSMQSHLEALSNLGSKVDVTRSLVDLTGSNANQGYTWTITFLGDGSDFALSVSEDKIVDSVGTSTYDLDLATNAATGTVAGGHTLGAASGTAAVTADPWRESPKNIIVGATYSACTGTQLVQGLTQGTPYYIRVFAWNALGYGLAVTHPSSQKPMKVPGPPTGTTISVTDSTTLLAIWSPPVDNGGDAVDQYLVEYDLFSNFTSGSGGVPLGSMVMATLSGGAPFHLSIPGLTMGVSYYVRIKAHNSQGYGPAQATTPSSDYPRAAPSKPTNVRLEVTSSTMLTVAYNTPDNSNGDTVTKYKVEWDTDSTFSSQLSLPDKGEKELQAALNMSYTIEGLSSASIYYVRVSAANKQGYSDAQAATPPFRQPSNQIPGKPSAISLTQPAGQNTQLRVQWSAPEIPDHGLYCSGGGSATGYTTHNRCPTGMGYGQDADGGSAITSYILEWDTVATFDGTEDGSTHKGKQTITNLATRPFTHTLSGLTCGRSYYVRVSAYNSIGDGKTCNQQGVGCDGAVLTAQPGPTC